MVIQMRNEKGALARCNRAMGDAGVKKPQKERAQSNL
jgi:hypothetical protein